MWITQNFSLPVRLNMFLLTKLGDIIREQVSSVQETTCSKQTIREEKNTLELFVGPVNLSNSCIIHGYTWVLYNANQKSVVVKDWGPNRYPFSTMVPPPISMLEDIWATVFPLLLHPYSSIFSSSLFASPGMVLKIDTNEAKGVTEDFSALLWWG